MTAIQTFDLSFGKAHVFYPEAGPERCTACLLLDVDPVGMVRRRPGASGRTQGLLGHYVNDRPYVASSFLSVALSQVLGTALGGRCKDRPHLAATPWPAEDGGPRRQQHPHGIAGPRAGRAELVAPLRALARDQDAVVAEAARWALDRLSGLPAAG